MSREVVKLSSTARQKCTLRGIPRSWTTKLRAKGGFDSSLIHGRFGVWGLEANPRKMQNKKEMKKGEEEKHVPENHGRKQKHEDSAGSRRHRVQPSARHCEQLKCWTAPSPLVPRVRPKDFRLDFGMTGSPQIAFTFLSAFDMGRAASRRLKGPCYADLHRALSSCCTNLSSHAHLTESNLVSASNQNRSLHMLTPKRQGKMPPLFEQVNMPLMLNRWKYQGSVDASKRMPRM